MYCCLDECTGHNSSATSNKHNLPVTSRSIQCTVQHSTGCTADLDLPIPGGVGRDLLKIWFPNDAPYTLRTPVLIGLNTPVLSQGFCRATSEMENNTAIKKNIHRQINFIKDSSVLI